MASGEVHSDGQVDQKAMRRVLGACFVGTALEWYDFFLYGTMAALVFDKLFFPNIDPTAASLAALSTFAAGFVARPIGGIIFGHYGDKLGRKRMLIISLVMMGIATFLIGLLPTYETIGFAAPVILVLLRVVQGLGVGGEWGGAALMAIEHAPRSRRGFYGAFTQMGVPGGLLSSTVVVLLVSSSVSDEAFLAWAWRIPFLISHRPGRGRALRAPAHPRVAGVRGGQGARARAEHPARGHHPRSSEEPAHRHGRAHRRERALLPVHGVHPRVRRVRARDGARPAPDRGDRGRDHRPGLHAAVRRAVRPCRAAAGLPVRRRGVARVLLRLHPDDRHAARSR